MKTASNQNVVHINKFDKSRISNSSTTQFLNDSRDMTASKLVIALSDMLGKAVDEFFLLSETNTGFEMRNLYMEAMTLARDKRAILESGFKQQFLLSFAKETRKDKNASFSASNSLESDFSLVDPDELEESLAAINIANNIHGTCAEALFGIEKRIGVLLHDPELSNHNNPIGPEVIGAAFMEALKDWNCDVKVKLLLVRLFNKYMPDQLKDMYQEINQHLVEKGVLPKIRVGMKKQASSAPASGMTLPAGGIVAGQPVAGGNELFATLQQLLTLGSGGMGISQPGITGGFAGGVAGNGGAIGSNSGGIAGTPVQIGSGVLEALNKLQHGQIEGFVSNGGALDAAAFTGGRTNVLREIKSSSVANTLGHVDSMTLDIVAMLFDYILDDRNIPDAIKALIGRLQIPMLKVAMMDKTFFSQKSHPARKFLDTLAGAAIGWDEAEGHQGGLYRLVDSLVQKVLNEFEDEVGIFVEVGDELEQFLAVEKHQADELTGRSAQVIHHQEREEIAKIMAHDEVRRRIHAQHLPEVIRNFLTGYWKPLLTSAYIQTGEDGVRWNNAIDTMDNLVWSVTSKPAPEDRKKLVSLLPGLLKRLQDGMETTGMPEAERNAFFSTLVRCHADAVKSGLQTATAEAAAAEEFNASELDLPDDFALDLSSDTEAHMDFEEIALPATPLEPDFNLLQEISNIADEHAVNKMNELTLSDDTWQESSEVEGDDYTTMVSRLKRGTWIEFSQADGTCTRAKLAWVSPMKGLYLFTNRLGERAVSITPSGLEMKFRNGQAEIINDDNLVDRAVSSLLDRLNQPVSSMQ